MDARQRKRFELLERLLSSAAAQIRDHEAYPECGNFLEHNEFGLAFDVLMEVGAEAAVTSHYWHLLKKAAEVMGMSEHLPELRRRRLAARQSAIHGGVAAMRPTLYGRVRVVSISDQRFATLVPTFRRNPAVGDVGVAIEEYKTPRHAFEVECADENGLPYWVEPMYAEELEAYVPTGVA